MSGRGVRKNFTMTKSERAGLVFPVARFHRYLKNQFSTSGRYRISAGAAVYVASVLEYLVAEVNEQAGNVAKVNKRKRISPRHIMWAVFQDSEMNQLLKHVILPSTGRPVAPIQLSPKSVVKHDTITEVKKPVKPGKAPKQKTTIKVPTPSRSILKPRQSKIIATKKVRKGKATAAGVETGVTEVLNERTLFLGQKLTVIQGDIVNVKADAVVHPTGSSCDFAGQVGGALLAKGGRALSEEVRKLRLTQPSIKTCEVAVTSAVNIPYKHIIHVNSPGWHNDVNEAVGNLEKAITNILDVADQHNIKSIAMPSISSGGCGYPKQVAAETILRTINGYFAGVAQSGIKQIFFVIYDKETLDVYKAELTRLA